MNYMTNIEQYKKEGRDLTRLLLANSFPIAVKMLRFENEIPKNALRPIKDLEHHIAVCQGFAMSRREGKTVATLKEDMWCFEPVVGFGLAEPPVRFLEGHNRYPNTAKTLQAGKTWAQNMPRLPMNKYIGVVSSPLERVEFEPDLVIVYCDNAQLTQLLMAANWIDGHDVESRLSAHAACVYTIANILKEQNFSVCAPCQGDHRRALAQDNEIIFGIPIAIGGTLWILHEMKKKP